MWGKVYKREVLIVSNLVNRGISMVGGTRKPVQLVVYKRGSKARERKEKNSSAARYFI